MDFLLTIGEVAARTGLATSAIRFYEEKGLVTSERASSGQRRFRRDTLRRIAFIRVAQRVGVSLDEITEALATLPAGRTPTRSDWARLSKKWQDRLDERIALLQGLRDGLTSCIGCGCLSLATCRLYNPDDRASAFGPGPRFLLGDSREEIRNRSG